MTSSPKRMLDYPAPKGDHEASLSGDDGDSFGVLESQVDLPIPAAEGGGLLGQYKYLARKLWALPPVQVGDEEGPASASPAQFGLLRKP